VAYDYQLVIIGAGSAGLSAADLSAGLGFTRVALVEASDRLGGECLHSGCVPSKALLHIAKQYGHEKDPWGHVQKSISLIQNRSDNDEHFQDRGVSVLHGRAAFVDAHTITLDGQRRITSKYYLLATGSRPRVPDIAGLSDSGYHTNETIFSLDATPATLAILGGGPIGCELAMAFALLGTKVSLIQSGPRLLPREEASVSEAVRARMKELGVQLYPNTDVQRVHKTADTKVLTLQQDGAQQTIEAAQLLVAVGRQPVLESLDLEKAGVQYDDAGVHTNRYFQTGQRNIYAVGDCTPSPKFTHLAGHQAGVALRNMITPLFKKSGRYLDVTPWITYLQPEIGRIGMTEAEVKDAGLPHIVLQLNLRDIDRAITDDAYEGYVKAIVDKGGKLLGATVLADNAGELLTPLCHIYYHKQSIASLATTVIPYPTFASGLNLLAARYASETTRQNSLFRLLTRKWRTPN
jgi:pyruvate/2-oxoglutarate dehydrogenase complex dihydrolipoamide dehydrogenase (E3) component